MAGARDVPIVESFGRSDIDNGDTKRVVDGAAGINIRLCDGKQFLHPHEKVGFGVLVGYGLGEVYLALQGN